MPRGPVLTVVITSATEGLDKGLTAAEKKLGGLAAKGGKLAKVAKVAAPIAGIAAVTAKLGKEAGKAALASDSWAKAMGELGVESAKTDPALQDAIAASKGLAFSTGATRDALLALTTATGDSTKAIDLLGPAQDIARLSGADLATVAEAMAKALNGNDRALKALIPGLQSGADGMETIANASKIAAGQADLYADSTEGMADKTKMAFKSLVMSIAKAVLPAFQAMLAALLPIIEALGRLVETLLPILLPLIEKIGKAFEIAAKGVAKLVDWIGKLITKINKLLDPLREAVDKLHQLDFNPFGRAGAAPQAALAAGALAAGGGSGRGNVNINIYGDPAVIEARVIRALKGYQMRNGTASLITAGRW